MEFCDQFLQMVATQMQGIDSPYTVIKFEYNPSKEKTIKYHVYENRNPLSFIPAWYIEKFESNGIK